MKRNLGNIIIIILVVLTITIWIVFPPDREGVQNYERYYAGEMLGSLMILFMSCSLFISTRPKWAESYFGGLDKMYMTHRRTSTSAFLLMFVHVLTVPITIMNLRIGNYLGMIAFLGIVAIVLPTLAPRMPFLGRLAGNDYEDWKKLHRYVGIFFFVGYLHSISVNAPSAKVAINWTQIFVILGTASYLYTEVFGRFFKKYLPYTVEAVKHPNNATTEVTMRARKEPIKKQRAGQFLFVRFLGDKGLNESHPFTISSAPSEDVLRLTIKASGDFTRRLFEDLKVDTQALIEGAYGMFDYKLGGEKQIWLAGGIGVTPFLSFVRDLQDDLSHDVDFYYTVRNRDEAVFVDEIEEADRKNPRLQTYVRASSTDGSLTIEDIVKNAGGSVKDRDVYLCGPLPMIQAFEKKFLEAGVPPGNIHYEEFNFR